MVLLCCRLKQQNILYSADGPDRNVLKFKPPMCFTKENVDFLLQKIDTVLSEMEDGSVDTSAETTKRLMFGSANGPLAQKELKRNAGKDTETTVVAGSSGCNEDDEPLLKKIRRQMCVNEREERNGKSEERDRES